MANDVVLSAASRSNLLSLQSTQKMIDSTQLRLATGKKVNSALDNPQSFFQSQSLSNRASDLTRLLDGIGQSIRTIEAADKGITAMTKLLEQADAIVNSARDALASSDGEARVVGSRDLRNIDNLVGQGGIAAADTIVFRTTDDAGNAITQSVAITAGDTGYTLAAKITNAFADNANGEISAKINDKTGFLEIQSKGGRTFKMGDGAVLGTGAGLGSTGYDALGIGKYFETEQRGAAANLYVNATIVGGNKVSTISLYEAPGNLADAGDVISGKTYTDATGNVAIANVAAADTISFQVNAGTAPTAIALTATTTFQDVVDYVNQDATLNKLIKANFNSMTGQIEVTSLSDTVENISINFNTPAAVANREFKLGWGGNNNLDPITPTTTTSAYKTNISFNSSTQALDGYSKDFNTVRGQINDLVKDAQYRGVNLLNGDDMTTFFNEDNTSKLTTEGTIFTAEGLGLVEANFTSAASVDKMSSLVKEATGTVRSFGSSLSNNLAVIQARQTFTQETINTLKAGAADLINADLNEEGANLLALQTAQQLGVTSLSLASQSQQSVLRLF